MSDEGDQLEGELPLEGAGQRLMRARENAGMTLAEVAAETRIPMRHLETLESGDFAALPAKTYAIGFARTYARVVDLDEQEIATQVRSELSEHDGSESHGSMTFEPGDPARLPSRGLAWFSVFAVILLIVGAFAFFRGYFIPGSGPGSIIEPEDAPVTLASGEVAGDGSDTDGETGTTTAGPAPTGAVVFTSMEEGVWVSFYDSTGERLMEKQMTQGETYTVPTGVDGPQIRTGRPESLTIRIGGKSIGALSNRSEIVSDIPVTSSALVARMAELKAEAAAEAASQGPSQGGAAE